jgi:DNA-binding protein HU-beta
MTKAELVAAIAAKAGLTKKAAEKALNAFTGSVADTLGKGESVALVGFGTFKVAKRAARTGRNPRTGKKMTIAAAKVPVFRPGKGLKSAV